AVHKLADDEGACVEVAEIVDDEDVRMIERRSGSRLGVKPAQTVGVRGDLRRQELQCDRAIELRIVGSINLAHAASADPGVDAIRADGAAGQFVHGEGGNLNAYEETGRVQKGKAGPKGPAL